MAIRQFTVMIVRKRYSSPYRRTTYLVLRSASLFSKKKFTSELNSHCENWNDATYFLKDDKGVFARFEVKEGKIIKFYKNSPITELIYPCWENFKK